MSESRKKKSEDLIVKDPASWARVAAEAMAQKSQDLIALESKPVTFGQPIAWSTHAIVGNATNGLSSLHRVGHPKGNQAYTTCEQPIPEPARWLALSPAFQRALAPCGFCEANYAEQKREMARNSAQAA